MIFWGKVRDSGVEMSFLEVCVREVRVKWGICG